MPDCPDFLHEFPAVMEQLLKYSQLLFVPSVRLTVQAAQDVDLDK